MTALLLAALIAVESGGNAAAVGDGGRAVGALQIHASVVADVNRVYRTRFTLADRRCPAKSAELCRLYLAHWVTAERLGRAPTAEDYARAWNGGPQGWRRAATKDYWRKVQRHLQ